MDQPGQLHRVRRKHPLVITRESSPLSPPLPNRLAYKPVRPTTLSVLLLRVRQHLTPLTRLEQLLPILIQRPLVLSCFLTNYALHPGPDTTIKEPEDTDYPKPAVILPFLTVNKNPHRSRLLTDTKLTLYGPFLRGPARLTPYTGRPQNPTSRVKVFTIVTN